MKIVGSFPGSLVESTSQKETIESAGKEKVKPIDLSQQKGGSQNPSDGSQGDVKQGLARFFQKIQLKQVQDLEDQAADKRKRALEKYKKAKGAPLQTGLNLSKAS